MSVYYGNTKIGNAELERRGMFYRIRCNCKVPNGTRCCLWYIDEENTINLGTYVPDTGITASIRIKGPASGKLILKNKSDCKLTDVYYLQDLNDVYPILSNLNNLYLVRTDSHVGIAVKSQDPD